MVYSQREHFFRNCFGIRQKTCAESSSRNTALVISIQQLLFIFDQNCLRKLSALPWNKRISLMPYLTIARRSMPIPKAKPEYSSWINIARFHYIRMHSPEPKSFYPGVFFYISSILLRRMDRIYLFLCLVLQRKIAWTCAYFKSCLKNVVKIFLRC